MIYEVLNEIALVYREPGAAFAGVLASGIGGPDWKNGPVAIVDGVDKVRPAKLVDFARFRVDAKGYIEKRFYVSIVRGSKVGYLLGPYDSEPAARVHVGRASRSAMAVDPRAAFDSFGVVGVSLEPGRAFPPGVLNSRIELEGEIEL